MRAQTRTLGQSIMMILLEEFTVPIDGFRGLPVIFEHVPHPFYARTPIGHVYHVHRISNLGVEPEGLRKPFGAVVRNTARDERRRNLAAVPGGRHGGNYSVSP